MPITVDELITKNKDVDPFLVRKWERVFSLFFDTNMSKSVDYGDFYLVLRRARDIYGAESAQMSFAKNSLSALWEGLCATADSNKDKIISIDEWVNLLHGTDANHAPKWLDDYATYMFKLFDVSADGVMDSAEYADGMGAYGYREAECHKTFQRFAVDEKGKETKTITPSQWKKLFYEYFFSTDKKALGNHLFGIMDL